MRALAAARSSADELALLHQLVEQPVDALFALVGPIALRVDEHDLDARLRRDLRDAAAHLSGADDPDLLNVHIDPCFG